MPSIGFAPGSDTRMAAALNPIGGLLGVQEFPATPAGYAQPLAWLRGFGTVYLVGIGGTGSYGAGLARRFAAADDGVVEVEPVGPAGSPPPGQVRSAGRGQRGPGCAVRPGPRRFQGPGRPGRGDPGADGRQAHRPRPADPDDQPGRPFPTQARSGFRRAPPNPSQFRAPARPISLIMPNARLNSRRGTTSTLVTGARCGPVNPSAQPTLVRTQHLPRHISPAQVPCEELIAVG